MSFQFSLGIDLGTSNSAIAVADFATGRSSIVEITQILGPNQIGELPTLASALYLPHPEEFSAEAVQVPWENPEPGIVGHFAREHGTLVPDRLVTSAKSWLSNPHIDPRQPVLPWGSAVSEKLSPFECSRRYLAHLKAGFLHAEATEGRHWDLSQGQIVLTVPASFDEVARNLTYEAAEAAGLPNVVLLEEPQAAFYAWTAQAGADWRTQVGAGDIVLVCDVGGGTADFSLIAVTSNGGNLELERISVGEHLLLGGDNMDLALAYTLRAQLEDEGKTIDDWQFHSLIQGARAAKVQLFSDPSLGESPVTVPSRGSSLFGGGTLTTRLHRGTLEQIVIDGFFEMTRVTDIPVETGGAALQEFGLPYASDPVVSKHLARFLTRSLQNVQASTSLAELAGNPTGNYLKPSAVLFNGGVFKAQPVRQRVLDLLASWNDGQPVRALIGDEPDLAVARGAAFYGENRATGHGIRIKAGTARSYYIGLESSMPAVPGFKPPVKALCVVPQGMEEGTECLVEGREFGLVTGKPASFRFFSSEIRSGDTPGQILPNAERELDETSRIEVNLPALEGFAEGQVVPVKIDSVVTEMGNLELWMNHTASDQRWKVEFQVRTE